MFCVSASLRVFSLSWTPVPWYCLPLFPLSRILRRSLSRPPSRPVACTCDFGMSARLSQRCLCAWRWSCNYRGSDFLLTRVTVAVRGVLRYPEAVCFTLAKTATFGENFLDGFDTFVVCMVVRVRVSVVVQDCVDPGVSSVLRWQVGKVP